MDDAPPPRSFLGHLSPGFFETWRQRCAELAAARSSLRLPAAAPSAATRPRPASPCVRAAVTDPIVPTAEQSTARPELITRKRAAELLDMDPRTFDARVRPRLRDYGLGGRPRYRAAEVIAAAEQGAQVATPVPSERPNRAPPPSPSRRLRHFRRRRAQSRTRRDLGRAIRAIEDHTQALYALADSFSVAVQQAHERHALDGKTPPPRLVSSARGLEILSELDDE